MRSISNTTHSQTSLERTKHSKTISYLLILPLFFALILQSQTTQTIGHRAAEKQQLTLTECSICPGHRWERMLINFHKLPECSLCTSRGKAQGLHAFSLGHHVCPGDCTRVEKDTFQRSGEPHTADLDTDKQVDPGRSKKRMKEAEDTCSPPSWPRSLRQCPGLIRRGPLIRRPGQSVQACGVQKEMQMGSKVLVPHTGRFMANAEL